MRRLSLALTLALLAVPGAPPSAGAAPPEVPSTDEIYRTTAEVAAFGARRTGTPQGRAAADFVERRLESYGVDAWQEHATSYLWEPKRWALEVEGKAVDAFPSWHSFTDSADDTGPFTTGPNGRTAEIVDVGDGSVAAFRRADVRGKIVLFNLRFYTPLYALGFASEFLYDPRLTLLRDGSALKQANPYITSYTDTLKQAKARGAVGFVGVLVDYYDSNRYLNEYYRRLNVSIPGMWITKAEGQRVRGLMRGAAARPQATLTLEGERTEVQSNTVVGVLSGRSRETIQIQSHHDSMSEGAVEDATGVAEVLALAKAFASVPASEREKTLMFTTFDTHFTGYQAHKAFRDKYVLDPDSPYRLVANVTLEHIGLAGTVRNGKLVMGTLPEPRGIFRTGTSVVRNLIMKAVIRHRLERTAMIPANGADGIPTDASFLVPTKVPVISLVSGPIYLYDEDDTMDKVARDELRPVAQAFAYIVDQLDDLPAHVLRRGG